MLSPLLFIRLHIFNFNFQISKEFNQACTNKWELSKEKIKSDGSQIYQSSFMGRQNNSKIKKNITNQDDAIKIYLKGLMKSQNRVVELNYLCISQFYLMENPKIEKASSAYTQHLRHPTTKKSFETSETLNDSLPNIQFNKSTEKVNVIRNEVNDTKHQIAIIQSKLNNLRKLRQRNESRNQQNMTKIEFMTHVKERVRSDFEYKQKIRQQKQEELGVLKDQVGSLRQSLVTERKIAENNLYTIKYNEAEEERQRKKHHEYLIKKLKELDTLEISRKVKKIKEFHQSSASRLKDFETSRVHMSKDNYKEKVLTTLKQKQRAKSMLKKLKQEEQKLMQDVKMSQQIMLTSLYSLQTLNPERKKKRFSAVDKNNKYELDDYSNEQFET